MRSGNGGGALTDALGVRHRPARRPARIVSLVPSITELLFALGLGPQVVGRTDYCIHPAAGVAAVPAVGGTKDPRLDRLRALAPTHVILDIDENRREDVAAMRAFVPHLVVVHPAAPADNLALYRLLGALFHRRPQAERLCAAYAGELRKTRALAAALPERRVLYLIWQRPWMTVSRATYISRTLASIRWRTLPAASPVRYPVLESLATVLADADLVLCATEPFPFDAHRLAALRRAPDFAGRPLVLVDGTMTGWYGSRAITGLAYLRRLALAVPGALRDPMPAARR